MPESNELTPQTAWPWVVDQFSSRLSDVFEAMAGEKPSVVQEPLTAPLIEAGLYWKQPFSGAAGEIWLFAAESDWSAIGNRILSAAGMDDADAATLKSTYLEAAGQALSGMAQSFSAQCSREITPSGGIEAAGAPSGPEWTALRLTFQSGAILLVLGASPDLVDELTRTSENADRSASEDPPAKATLAFRDSRTFELLLDVELPVSVSFGRAQVPLKDVLKLTTGSIVELNRSIVEPVEVIVNNCVIARGEVVVVEGNFGVRIQEVISKQERLRTLA